jgi:hypothetical protein
VARYEHLPIYKQELDVAVYFEKVAAGFSRYHKDTLGTGQRNKSREAVTLVIKANAARDEREPLLALRDCLDERLIVMRIAKEARAFKSFSPSPTPSNRSYRIADRTRGWLRSAQKR